MAAEVVEATAVAEIQVDSTGRASQLEEQLALVLRLQGPDVLQIHQHFLHLSVPVVCEASHQRCRLHARHRSFEAGLFLARGAYVSWTGVTCHFEHCLRSFVVAAAHQYAERVALWVYRAAVQLVLLGTGLEVRTPVRPVRD